MQIKDYKCKCGHTDFIMRDNGNQKGIYCSKCGKWFKWADKDERNLMECFTQPRQQKAIDPFDIKAAIKNGQLEVYVKNDTIYIRDTSTWESAVIGTID